MNTFVKVGNSLVNVGRLLAVRHKPGKVLGAYEETEHYSLYFDTGKEIWATVDEGKELLRLYTSAGAGSGSNGTIASTADALT